ncbi:MAG: type I-F CRISPR-associated helicase Cas3f [Pseudomonadota bacterium]|nr:type I-F CRISPR-associated helicase Cas3f [Pseudomonadota bacterium]
MNVLFVSQCSKRALTETRRILDQFAERRGDRTWQTPITQAGLDTVRKLLRQTARKNTAVACHWIRGRDQSELLWIVGDARQFNAEGAVPTNTTTRDVLRREDESTWHHLPLMTALSALAALLHDLGKATKAFQQRLRAVNPATRNHYRHEWVSVRLWQAFVGTSKSDDDWLARLATCADEGVDGEAFAARWTDHQGGHLIRDGLDIAAAQDMRNNPFACLPPLAQVVAWLVLTHHRLPCKPVEYVGGDRDDDMESRRSRYRHFGARLSSLNRNELEGLLQRIDADWNEPREATDAATKEAHWVFPHGLPVAMLPWRKQAARYAHKLQAFAGTDESPLHDPFTMHVSRLCLMLADHHYSSIDDEARRKPYLNPGYPLHANTVRRQGEPVRLNQTLDEHLLGVQAHATLVARSLPTLTRSLPTLRNHRGLKKRSPNPRFQWQDKAADLAASVRTRTAEQGAFIVNMASTGCGKTLGNARIMNALADPQLGMRCAFAIGLRTLTLQTGRSFQHDLGLNDEQLAIYVGGAASRTLLEYWEQKAEATGSASRQQLMDEGSAVLYEGHTEHALLQRLSDDKKVRRLLAAPILACTVDHLTPATESLRGGRQIAPMLRLMTSDLVLDEPDDFDMADLPALTRLVHWAGLLGSRVLLSSATLPPALVEGLFLAYRAGRETYQRHRAARPGEPVSVCVLWVDEFRQDARDCAGKDAFRKAHQDFVNKRVARLAKDEVRRLAQIVALPGTWTGMPKPERRCDFARVLLESAWQLHQDSQNHTVDASTGKRVSLGLIRMANIQPLYDVALALYQQGASSLTRQSGVSVRVHLCVYHSQFPLHMRSAIERQLDTVLNRRADAHGADPVLQQAAVRVAVDPHPETDHLFIVLGSPVTEVGRDHDYDWAVVEPSSMRSLIQLAGRVRRHREGSANRVNLLVLDGNLRVFERGAGEAAYRWPGFEMDKVRRDSERPSGPPPHDSAWRFHLSSHRLQDLLPCWPDTGQAVTATPRVLCPDKLQPRHVLTDLEHARMQDTMLPRPPGSTFYTPLDRDATLHWAHTESPLGLTGLLPQLQRFRLETTKRTDVVFLPDDDEETLDFFTVFDDRRNRENLFVASETSLQRLPDATLHSDSVTPWLKVDPLTELQALAEALDMPLRTCAERFATASLPDHGTDGWRWHPALGFTRKA